VSAKRFSIVIAALGAVAIVAVLTAGGGIDLGGDDSKSDAREESEAPAETNSGAESDADAPAVPNSDAHMEAHADDREIPDDPDAVRGTDPFALTRPANLRRALAVLDRRRASVGGAFEGLRVAPGRIDTVIVHPDDRRTNIQIRPDFEVPFESTHDFPTQAGFRKTGLTAAAVDPTAPARLLRGIDGQRRGSAARDVDYVVIGRDIIDLGLDVTAYMRIRTPRPRYFRLEDGRVEAFG
jgi:hypothetical protein